MKIEFNATEIENKIRNVFREEFDRYIDILYARLVERMDYKPDFLTVTELCKELRISKATFYKRFNEGKIESEKDHGKRTITRKALEDYRNKSKH